MTEWRDIELGTVIDIFDHMRIPLNSQQRSERQGPYPYYGAQGVIDSVDAYLFDGRYLLVPEDGENLNSRKLPIAYFADGRFWVNNHAHIVRGKPDVCDDVFLKHLINNTDISPYVTGAAQPKLSQGSLKRIALKLPPVPIQRRIASVLGAYDDLIEVNRRRIAVLEEMARRLFDEWFVHFRFHGHEGHELVEMDQGRTPVGWKWEELQRVCVPRDGIQTGPFGSQLHQADYTEEGVPVAMPKNLIGLRIVTAGIARIPEALANSLGRHRMRRGDVVYGRRGDIGRRAYVSDREDGWFCGTGCLRLRPDQSRIAPRYFFDALGLAQTEGSIKGRAQGATMPNLSAGAMVGVPVLVPPLPLQRKYSELADISASLIANLSDANVRHAASRDLLLPRLISGELPVSATEANLEPVT